MMVCPFPLRTRIRTRAAIDGMRLMYRELTEEGRLIVGKRSKVGGMEHTETFAVAFAFPFPLSLPLGDLRCISLSSYSLSSPSS